MQPVEWGLMVTYTVSMVVEVMPADHYWVVAFVNEYGTEPRREANEQLKPYPSLDSLGKHDAALTSGLSEAQLVSVADDLHRVFASASREDAAQSLNDLLKDTRPEPRISVGGSSDGYEESWRVHATLPSDVPLKASCALMMMAVMSGSWRFGVCEASCCVDVFVDRSPGGRRRYCSSLCQNRTKVAAFREKRRRA
jgi:predicted RNA-binding Zn ribbon-like protein